MSHTMTNIYKPMPDMQENKTHWGFKVNDEVLLYHFIHLFSQCGFYSTNVDVQEGGFLCFSINELTHPIVEQRVGISKFRISCPHFILSLGSGQGWVRRVQTPIFLLISGCDPPRQSVLHLPGPAVQHLMAKVTPYSSALSSSLVVL